MGCPLNLAEFTDRAVWVHWKVGQLMVTLLLHKGSGWFNDIIMAFVLDPNSVNKIVRPLRHIQSTLALATANTWVFLHETWRWTEIVNIAELTKVELQIQSPFKALHLGPSLSSPCLVIMFSLSSWS